MIIKDEYEISLWIDRDENNEFVEHKVAIIGSDTMSSSFRAMEPVLVENVNGTHTFSFKMFYRCKDQEVGEYLGETYFPEPYLLEELYPALKANPTFDEIPKDGFINPFISLLQNERKVKVKWKNEWYDFIIKECNESSDKKTVTYKCIDLYINELAKNGFGLTFDNELMNNQGTAQQLATRVVDGTEWQVPDTEGNILEVVSDPPSYDEMVDVSGRTVPLDPNVSVPTPLVTSDKIYQENNEPVIEWHLLRSVIVSPDDGSSDAITISPLDLILIFYPPLANLSGSGTFNFQFAYAPSYPENAVNMLVDYAKSYSVKNAYYSVSNNTVTIKESAQGNNLAIVTLNGSGLNDGVSYRYRAIRYQDSQQCIFDPVSQKYCYVFKENSTNKKVYYFRDTAVDGATAVVNLLTNPCSFIDKDGWLPVGSTDIRLALYPANNSDPMIYDNARAYLRIDSAGWAYNSGISSYNAFLPDGFQVGTRFVCCYRIVSGNASGPTSATLKSIGSNIDIAHYTSNNGTITKGSSIVTAGQTGSCNIKLVDGDDEVKTWYYQIFEVKESISHNQMIDPNHRVGFFVRSNSGYAWIEQIQLFQYVAADPQTIPSVASNPPPFICPNQFATMALTNIRHNYYIPDNNPTAKTIDDIKFEYQSVEPYTGDKYTPIMNEYEKIRSIVGKQSNRFNLLQTIAEQFDCWVCFYINHNDTGHITKFDGTHLDKYVYFRRQLGQQKDFGFVYGIDLQTIQRTIQSDNIVTRTIVSPNNNEFAPYGSCNIVRAANNYSKSNSIFEFGYYLNNNLLDAEVLTKDLYSVNGLNYFNILRQQYSIYDAKIEEAARMEMELSKVRGYIELYSASTLSAAQLKETYKDQIYAIVGVGANVQNPTADSNVKTYIQNHSTTENIQELLQKWRKAAVDAEDYNRLQNDCLRTEAIIEAQLTILRNEQKQCLNIIKNAEETFFKKYSSFIQEGSWQDEDYMDDNLYYCDGLEVAYNSSRPQISYNISVLRLSALEEFQNKVFELGDLTWIQDKEFFGYYIDETTGAKTPFKEQVLISELTSYFEEPEKDNFTVQNYKTVYDDLFQRITAATQSLQFHEGEYARAANSFTSDGGLKASAIQKAFDENKDLLMSSNNNKIIQDENGITLYSTDDPLRQVRINANGLFITSDNGIHWKNAIRSNGVATETLTAGSINTELITLFSGDQPSFVWNKDGITAYNFSSIAQGTTRANHNQFTRFDKYGFYGIDASTISGSTHWYDDWVPGSTQDIVNNAKFGLTWSGFFFNGQNGSTKTVIDNTGIRISSGSTDKFYADTAGNVYFAGTLNGADGNFSGTITANDGKIGGWNIGSNALYSGTLSSWNSSGSGVYLGKSDTASYGIKIKSGSNVITLKDGQVIANNVVLSGQIQIGGSSYIPLAGSQIGGCNFSNTGLLQIPDANITNLDGSKINANSITAGQIATSAITADKIATNAVTANKINAGAITADKIAASAITADKISTGAVVANKIAANAITADNISSAAVTADKIATGAITANKIGASAITADKIAANAVAAGKIAANAVTADNLQSGSITTDKLVTTGITLTNGYIKNGKTSLSSTVNGFYLGTDGFNFGGSNSYIKYTYSTSTLVINAQLNVAGGAYIQDDVRIGALNSTYGYILIGNFADGTTYASNRGFAYIMDSTNHRGSILTLGTSRVVFNSTAGDTYTVGSEMFINYKMYQGSGSGSYLPSNKVYIGGSNTSGRLEGSWVSTNAIVVESDCNLKNNIKNIDKQYSDFFDLLRPVTFKYNNETVNQTHIGFIAQDVQSALIKSQLPVTEMGIYNETTVEKQLISGLRYEEFISLNTWQIQLLKQRINQLEQKIEQLVNKI